MKGKFILVCLLVSIVCVSNTVYVSADVGNFTTEPDAYEIERQKQYIHPMPKAYHRDINGNLVSTKIVDDQDIIRGTNMDISPMAYSENGYLYVFARYEPNTYKTDKYRFFISQVNWWNKTNKTIPLKYTQKETVTTEWDVSGKIEVDAEFKVKFLATLQGRFGLQVTKKDVTEKSNIVETEIEVSPGYEAYINKYKGGAYAGGSAVWDKYYILPDDGSIIYVGTYTETNQGGWGIMSNVTSYISGSRYRGKDN